MFSRREILAGAAAATAAQTLRAQAAPRPNVVIFLADDLGCHDLGASDLATPNIDALAAGLRTGNCLRQVFVSKTFTGDVKGQALAMVNRIEYPGQWRDYSTLRIEPGDVDRAVKFESRRQLAKFGKPVDRREGFMTPPAVDAYYNPQTNDMNFPAGVLQPPLFDPNMDDAPNYGNTGGTIGHERTHGFDQSSQYTVVDELKINGKLTLGEHVTDLGGRQRLANRRHQKKLEPIGSFTPEQRLFIGFAQWVCGEERPESKPAGAITNPHSPEEYRINGAVGKVPEFAKAFSCKSGQPMVRPQATVSGAQARCFFARLAALRETCFFLAV